MSGLNRCFAGTPQVVHHIQKRALPFPLLAVPWQTPCTLCPQGWTVQLMVSRTGLNVPEFQDTRSEFDPFRWLDGGSGSLR